MDYTYEIKKLSPKQEFMTVVYRAEGHPDYTRNFNPKQFDDAHIASVIEGGAQMVVEFWERSAGHPESVSVVTQGAGTFIPPEVVDYDFSPPEVEPEPVYDPLTQAIRLKQIEDPTQKTVGWEVIDLNEEEQAQRLADASVALRMRRNELLAETDYLLLSDTPEPSQAVLDYRQALRDITEGEGFPRNVVWPVKPEGV